MLIIDYSPTAFPAAYSQLAAPGELRCLWSDLVWAGLTVGRRSLRHVIRPETYAYFELVYRSTLLYTHLQAADYRPGLWGPIDTHLRQSEVYQALDPGEKASISYFIGLTMAKLFAERLLQTPWLSHLDTCQPVPAPQPAAAPDLIGLDRQGNWVVQEVRGRSNWLSRQTIQRAKSRGQRLGQIGGRKPGLWVGFAGYFTSTGKTLKVYLEDPPADGQSTLELQPEVFLTSYYRLLFELLTGDYGPKPFAESYGGRSYRVKPIVEADLRVGLDEQILEWLQTNRKLGLYRLAGLTPPQPSAQAETPEPITIGHDGILVELGERWGDTRMHLSPTER